MFRETNEEVMRMRLVNNRIHELVNSIRAKMADVCEWLVSHQRDCFEDDFEVEGTLKFSYNGDDSLLSYEGANVYGSDYRLMIAANNCLTGDDPFHFIELHCRYTDSRKAFFSQATLMMKCLGLMKLLEISMAFTFIIVLHVHVEIGDMLYRMSFNSTTIGQKLI